MKTLVILSGGMDSTTALYWAINNFGKSNVSALNFDYGSKHNKMEYQSARKICSNLRIKLKKISLPFINTLFKSDLLKSGGKIPEGHYEHESMRRTVVPFRNGIMLSIAVGYAESIGCERVIIGNHSGDHAIYPDCRKDFIEHMSTAAFNGTEKGILILSPFCQMKKDEIVLAAEELKAPLHKTYSCYNGRAKHCGKCGTCYERKEAFYLAGVDDRTSYEH